MNVQIIRGAEVTRPVPDPLTSSVLDHATVQETDSFGLRNNEGMWPSYNMLATTYQTVLCPTPDDDTQKTFLNGEWVTATEFAMYGGVKCAAVGLDKADMEAETKRVFAANEGKGVERYLLQHVFPEGTAMSPSDVDLPLAVAFAKLEGILAALYAGQPTIHMSRGAASLLGADKIVFEGDKAYSRLGAKIVMGGGYDPEPTGLWSLYGTGEVFIERSSQIDASTYTIPGDGSDEFGHSDNTVVVLAERLYRVAIDGPNIQISGKVY